MSNWLWMVADRALVVAASLAVAAVASVYWDYDNPNRTVIAGGGCGGGGSSFVLTSSPTYSQDTRIILVV